MTIFASAKYNAECFRGLIKPLQFTQGGPVVSNPLPFRYYQGRIREEGMQLTISPIATCEQKPYSIAICYLYFAQNSEIYF